MTCELWLVRHGQAAFTSADYDRLTDLGWQQARWLGAHLAGMEVSFDRIAAGPLRRQRETAEAVADALGGPVEEIAGWQEYDAAALMAGAGLVDRDPGRSRRAHFQVLREVLLDWVAGRAEGAETWDAFRVRVAAGVAQATAQGGRVLVAASGGSIAMAIATALELGAEQMIALNLQARNTGVSRLIFARDRVYLNQFNAVPHLERPDRRDAQTYS